MSSLSPQPIRPALARVLAVGLVGLTLGGCLGRGAAETTGSIDPSIKAAASPEALQASSEALGRRFEANPADAETAVAYARTLKARGQLVQAVAVLQQTALRSPRDLSVLAAYGKALADAGRLKEASEVLGRAHHPERPDWRILSAQGAIADQQGQFAQAQRYYETALKIAPGEPSILSNQGLSFALAKRLGDAERILVEAARHPRADARVRQNLALVLGLQGKFAEAEGALKRDLSPAQAADNLAAIKGMVRQPNSWTAIRQAEGAKAAVAPSRHPG